MRNPLTYKTFIKALDDANLMVEVIPFDMVETLQQILKEDVRLLRCHAKVCNT